jgi:hypothetical protein
MRLNGSQLNVGSFRTPIGTANAVSCLYLPFALLLFCSLNLLSFSRAEGLKVPLGSLTQYLYLCEF